MGTTNESITELPVGVWRVDPNAGELGFRARGMFGLVPVRGTFGDFDGTLTVDSAGTSGQLHIQSATLDTGNAKRDKHLRSADFFDVETHPTVTFELTGVKQAPAGAVTITGMLRIRDNALAIEAPAEISLTGSERMTLSTQLDVDRAAAGVGWSKLGMIKGAAQLSALITLIREA
jgi:polyisoprenoid-binding protein YceI